MQLIREVQQLLPLAPDTSPALPDAPATWRKVGRPASNPAWPPPCRVVWLAADAWGGARKGPCTLPFPLPRPTSHPYPASASAPPPPPNPAAGFGPAQDCPRRLPLPQCPPHQAPGVQPPGAIHLLAVPAVYCALDGRKRGGGRCQGGGGNALAVHSTHQSRVISPIPSDAAQVCRRAASPPPTASAACSASWSSCPPAARGSRARRC